MLTPKGLQLELDALTAKLEGGIGEEDASRLHGKICSLFRSLDETISEARPMLLLTFDDAEGDPVFVCNPTLNLRFGDDLERCTWFDQDALNLPPICRTLGQDATSCCQAVFTLSKIVRDAGFDSLVEIPEMTAEDFRDQLMRANEPAPTV